MNNPFDIAKQEQYATEQLNKATVQVAVSVARKMWPGDPICQLAAYHRICREFDNMDAQTELIDMPKGRSVIWLDYRGRREIVTLHEYVMSFNKLAFDERIARVLMGYLPAINTLYYRVLQSTPAPDGGESEAT